MKTPKFYKRGHKVKNEYDLLEHLKSIRFILMVANTCFKMATHQLGGKYRAATSFIMNVHWVFLSAHRYLTCNHKSSTT